MCEQQRELMEQGMSRLTREIQEHYFQGHEQERLSNNEGELERLRTQAILSRFLQPPPAVLLDVGGGAGIHAFALAEKGYDVHLIDPIELHLKQAREHSDKVGVKLASITLGDACDLSVASGTIDSVLLLGPLYHLIEPSKRLKALGEAYRVLREGGILFAAAISRFASLLDGLAGNHFRDAAFREIVAADLATGQHRNPSGHPAYFTSAFFHRPEDLVREVGEAGFKAPQVLAIEGPV